MEPLEILLAVLAALLLSAGVAILWLLSERYRLTAERDLARARLADEARAKSDFQSVAGEVLRNSNQEFLRLAQQTLAVKEGESLALMDRRREEVDRLIQPIQRAIEDTHHHLRRTEKDNAGLREQVLRMNKSNSQLRSETSKLVQALRKPNVRGRYGEIQLERVIELAGMRAAALENLERALELRPADTRLMRRFEALSVEGD